MKKIFLLFFLVCFYFPGNAQTEEQRQVQNVIIKMFDALAARDINQIQSLGTKDILILENGLIWNMDSLVVKTNQNKLAVDYKRINTLDFLNTEVDQNTAWTTYNNQAEITKNGKHFIVTWLESAILVKEKNHWKIKVLHSTFLKRTPI